MATTQILTRTHKLKEIVMEKQTRSMKTVGIIGGLGPQTTAEFYLQIVYQLAQGHSFQNPPLIIDSVPLRKDVEKEAIVEGWGEERCVPLLVDSAQRLERAGADFLVLPCNSLHAFINEVRGAVDIPVLSILEVAGNFLRNFGVQEVGIISTEMTLKRKLYESALAQRGIKSCIPSGREQAELGSIIHHLVSGEVREQDKDFLVKVVDSFLSKGVRHVLLACTDLQLLKPTHGQVKIFDTMKILADAVLQEMDLTLEWGITGGEW